VETIKTGRSELRMAVRSQVKVLCRGLSLSAYIGCIRPRCLLECDTTAPLQLQLPLVAVYKCYAFTFLPLSTVINDIIML